MKFGLLYNHKRILEELSFRELPDDKSQAKPRHRSNPSHNNIGMNDYDAFMLKGTLCALEKSDRGVYGAGALGSLSLEAGTR